MRILTLTVEPDGRIAIPGTHAGQTITIHLEPETEPEPAVVRRSAEEQERVIQALVAGGRRVREAADPEWLALDHDELLYGPDGLPK